MVMVRGTKPRQPSWPAGLSTPAETQTYQEPSVVLGQASRPAPLKLRLSFSSTAQPSSSNLLPGVVSPLVKYCRTPWPVVCGLVTVRSRYQCH
jgi:hypothetical protein